MIVEHFSFSSDAPCNGKDLRLSKILQVLLTHEHADAVLGLDDLHCVKQFHHDVSPIPLYATQDCLDR